MKDKIKNRIKKILDARYFNVLMVFVIILFICLISGIITLIYNVEGESNLPFNLVKISTISTIEGIDVENSEHKWDLNVNQNNDVYLYIEKNNSYKGTEIIKNIKVQNFVINSKSSIGELYLYRPDGDVLNSIFKNVESNRCDQVQYEGDLESSIKALKIANQGGLVVFRYSLENLGNFISDDLDEVNHAELLQKLDVKNEDVKFNVSFDVVMELESHKVYKATVTLDLPIGNVVDDGVQVNEDFDLKNIVFKRT